MLRTICLALGIVAVVAVIAIAAGTLAPPAGSHNTYASALSDAAVETAAAEVNVPCNDRACMNPSKCGYTAGWACSVQGHNCVDTACP